MATPSHRPYANRCRADELRPRDRIDYPAWIVEMVKPTDDGHVNIKFTHLSEPFRRPADEMFYLAL